MKLRNKKTGEIDDFVFEVIADRIDIYRRVGSSDTKNIWHYNSLAELYEEWEDAPEEPKEFWFIDSGGEVVESTYITDYDKTNLRKFGNYFETKEEAERAVEKLKAWKRLKDEGFKFEGIKEDFTRILQSQEPFRTGKRYLQFNKSEDEEWMKENWEDLDLLFGGD